MLNQKKFVLAAVGLLTGLSVGVAHAQSMIARELTPKNGAWIEVPAQTEQIWISRSHLLMIEPNESCQSNGAHKRCAQIKVFLVDKSKETLEALLAEVKFSADSSKVTQYTIEQGNMVYGLDVVSGQWAIMANGKPILENAYLVQEPGIVRFEVLDDGWLQGYVPDEPTTDAKKCEHNFYYDENGLYDGYASGSVCFYPHKTLSQAYADFRNENINNENGRYLRERLTLKQHVKDVIDMEGVDLNIEYSWPNEKHLHLELSFAGGVTTFEIIQTENGVIIKELYSAD